MNNIIGIKCYKNACKCIQFGQLLFKSKALSAIPLTYLGTAIAGHVVQWNANQMASIYNRLTGVETLTNPEDLVNINFILNFEAFNNWMTRHDKKILVCFSNH